LTYAQAFKVSVWMCMVPPPVIENISKRVAIAFHKFHSQTVPVAFLSGQKMNSG